MELSTEESGQVELEGSGEMDDLDSADEVKHVLSSSDSDMGVLGDELQGLSLINSSVRMDSSGDESQSESDIDEFRPPLDSSSESEEGGVM